MRGQSDGRLEEGRSLKQQLFRISLDLGSMLMLQQWQQKVSGFLVLRVGVPSNELVVQVHPPGRQSDSR